MAHRKISPITFVAILLATATVTQVVGEFAVKTPTLAQSFGENPDSFPIPNALPDGSTLRVDGSTSMRLTNEEVASRFEQQFPNIDVQLDSSNTDDALAALLNGDVGVVASGRPLTDAEKAQGLVEVPIQREKLAIILGPDNPFNGNLSFEQFAQIFRGEITNWSEVGGPNAPIRMVDRPDYSDTRRALSTYQVFEGRPFETGNTADSVSDDETDDVIAALGDDGIGYAVASQVFARDDVRILSMHGTLPDDPRYPYSQYRAFIYNENPAPPVQAFLGFATTLPGQEVFGGDSAGTTGADAEGADAEGADADGADAAGAGTEGADGTTGATSDSSSDAETGQDTTLAPGTEAIDGETAGRFPWWLLWLLGIPLLGGLLWWLMKGKEGTTPTGASAASPAAAPTGGAGASPTEGGVASTGAAVTPGAGVAAAGTGGSGAATTGSGVAGAAGVAGTGSGVAGAAGVAAGVAAAGAAAAAAAAGAADGDEGAGGAAGTGTAAAEAADGDRAAAAGDGGSGAAAAAGNGGSGAAAAGVVAGAAGVAAAAGAAAAGVAPVIPPIVPGASEPRMVLTPRASREAYASWEIPGDRLEEAKRQGGEKQMVRLYDVTGQAPDAPLPTHLTEFECTGSDPNLNMPIELGDRDYRAEVGYLTADQTWLPLVASNSIHIPAAVDGTAVDGTTIDGTGDVSGAELSGARLGDAALGGAGLGGAALGGAALAGAAALGAAGLAGAGRSPESGRVTVTPTDSQNIHVHWDIPGDRLEAVKGQGYRPMVRLYDVTGQAPEATLPTHTAEFECPETAQEMDIPIATPDRDYVAEVGYLTPENRWLSLAKSDAVQISGTAAESATAPGIPGGAIGGAALAAGAAALGIAGLAKGSDEDSATLAPDDTAAVPLQFDPGRVAITPRNRQDVDVSWEVSEQTQAKLKAQGYNDYQLRIYDVTDLDISEHPPHDVMTYDLAETDRDRLVRLPDPRRDYIAAIGYRTKNDGWLELACSGQVRPDSFLQQFSDASGSDASNSDASDSNAYDSDASGSDSSGLPLGAITGGAAALAGGLAMGAVVGDGSSESQPASREVSHVAIEPQPDKTARVSWNIADAAKAEAQQQGGSDFQVRVYDVTAIDLDTQPAYRVDTYSCSDAEGQYSVSLPQAERDYLAEVGYATPDNRWIKLARSPHIHVPARDDAAIATGLGLGAVAATGLGLAAIATPQSAEPETTDHHESRAIIAPHTERAMMVSWFVAEQDKIEAQQQGGEDFQVRVYDVTAIDLDTQSAHRMDEYSCDVEQGLHSVPIPQVDRDYLAEVGYATSDNRWIRLVRSSHIHTPAEYKGGAMLPQRGVANATGLGVAAAATALATGVETVAPPSTTGSCAIKTIRVHSRHNALELDEAQVNHLTQTVSTTHSLETGLYILRIRDGMFNYGEVSYPGEPFVLLWIFGGKVMNQKTNVPVTSTWSTLNGYTDTLTLHVHEPATLHAFFLDTHPDDNRGEITLSVIKL
ncbi:MAG: DUF4912 domain-containing protein [Elainellaceae cyanobacterium]